MKISLKGAYAVIYLNFVCDKQTNLLNTVKPVYKDHSREKAKTVVIDRWYL